MSELKWSSAFIPTFEVRAGKTGCYLEWNKKLQSFVVGFRGHDMADAKVRNLIIAVAGPYGAGGSSLCEELGSLIADWPGCMVQKVSVRSIIEAWHKIICEGAIITDIATGAESRAVAELSGPDEGKRCFLGQ